MWVHIAKWKVKFIHSLLVKPDKTVRITVKSIIKGNIYPEQRINIDYKYVNHFSSHNSFHLDFKGELFRCVTALVKYNIINSVKITFH